MKPTIPPLNSEELQAFLEYYSKLPKRPTKRAEFDAEVVYWYKNVYERNNNLAAYKPRNARN